MSNVERLLVRLNNVRSWPKPAHRSLTRSGSVMRRQFIPQAAEGGRGFVFALAAQLAHFAQQQVDLVLLFGHQGVEGVEQVFGVAELDFQPCQLLQNPSSTTHATPNARCCTKR